jgi:NADH:ubiquinone oxidoreductase subunit 3 (subunit A)
LCQGLSSRNALLDVRVLRPEIDRLSGRKSGANEPRQRFNSLTFFLGAKMALEAYVPVVIFALIALLFPLGTFFATRLFRPDHPTPLKDLTYECGEVPEGEAQIQFHFQYYMFALIFVVFDVAAVFLLLWAFAWGGLLTLASPVSKFSIFLFLGIMFVATQYALKEEEVIQI